MKIKKTAAVIISAFLIFLGIMPFSAHADDSDDFHDEITEQLDSALSDFDLGISYDDISGLSLGEIVSLIGDKLSDRLAAPLKMLSAIFLVIVITSVLKTSAGGVMGGASGEIYNMVCAISAVAVIVPQLLDLYSGTLTDIQVCGSFILVFVPVLSAIAIACGGFSSAGVYHMMTLGASEMLIRLSESYLLPILGTTAALSVTGSVFPNTSLESIVSILKKTVTWTISVAMTLFTGFVTLKCSISAKSDGAAAKTAKMIVSGFVPIVGGAVSDAYATVKGSFEVIGSTVGAAGIIGIVILLLPKLIELFIYRAVMWIGSAAADVFSADPVSKLLKGLDSGLAIAQCILVCYSLMFIISSAILTQTIS